MADRITYTPGRKPYTMKNKARFARLINQRLEALDRPAAWLARQVGQADANIARWRDENLRTMPDDADVVWRLAKALDMDVAETNSFFAAAGLHVPPVQADRASIPPSPPGAPYVFYGVEPLPHHYVVRAAALDALKEALLGISIMADRDVLRSIATDWSRIARRCRLALLSVSRKRGESRE